MTCDEYQRKASLYVDGDLADAESESLFEHLSTCMDCRSFVRAILEIRSKIHDDLLKDNYRTSAGQSSSVKMTFMLPLVVLIMALLLALGFSDFSIPKVNTSPDVDQATPWNLLPHRPGGQF